MKDKIQADSKTIDRVDEEAKERRRRREGFACIVTEKVTSSPHRSNTNPPITPLSKNDLDSVDILQLVLAQNMCVSSAPQTYSYSPRSVSGGQRATGRNAAPWERT